MSKSTLRVRSPLDEGKNADSAMPNRAIGQPRTVLESGYLPLLPSASPSPLPRRPSSAREIPRSAAASTGLLCPARIPSLETSSQICRVRLSAGARHPTGWLLPSRSMGARSSASTSTLCVAGIGGPPRPSCHASTESPSRLLLSRDGVSSRRGDPVHVPRREARIARAVASRRARWDPAGASDRRSRSAEELTPPTPARAALVSDPRFRPARLG